MTGLKNAELTRLIAAELGVTVGQRCWLDGRGRKVPAWVQGGDTLVLRGSRFSLADPDCFEKVREFLGLPGAE